jgi:hypothetical protein
VTTRSLFTEIQISEIIGHIIKELNDPFDKQPVFYMGDDVFETIAPVIDVAESSDSIKFRLDVIEGAILAWGFLTTDGFHDERDPWEFDLFFPPSIRITNLPIFHRYRTKVGEIQGIALDVKRLFSQSELVEGEISGSVVVNADGPAISTFAKVTLPISPRIAFVNVIPSE